MLKRNFLLALAIFTGLVAGAFAEDPWMVLPPTPPLPAAAKRGYATVNNIKIW